MSDDEKKAGFGVISKDVYHRREISSVAKAVYGFLATYADATGQCYPSMDTMRYHLNMGENRIRSSIKELKNAGILSVERERRGNLMEKNHYFLHDGLRNGQSGCIEFRPVEPRPVEAGNIEHGDIESRPVEPRPVQNEGGNNTRSTAPIKQNQRVKKTSTNSICQQVCDLLNRRRSELNTNGRTKNGHSDIAELLENGLDEDYIIRLCREFCGSISSKVRAYELTPFGLVKYAREQKII